MPLTSQDIQDFQTAYFKSFQEEISFNEAQMMANELVLFLHELLSMPEPEEKPSGDLSTGASLDFMGPQSD